MRHAPAPARRRRCALELRAAHGATIAAARQEAANADAAEGPLAAADHPPAQAGGGYDARHASSSYSTPSKSPAGSVAPDLLGADEAALWATASAALRRDGGLLSRLRKDGSGGTHVGGWNVEVRASRARWWERGVRAVRIGAGGSSSEPPLGSVVVAVTRGAARRRTTVEGRNATVARANAGVAGARGSGGGVAPTATDEVRDLLSRAGRGRGRGGGGGRVQDEAIGNNESSPLSKSGSGDSLGSGGGRKGLRGEVLCALDQVRIESHRHRSPLSLSRDVLERRRR